MPFYPSGSVVECPFVWTLSGSNTGYQYRRSLTISSASVPSDQANFKVLVSFTDATFKTVANGGHVQDANGYDIAFFSDSGLTTPLNFDLAFYDGTNGVIVFWVLLDLSSTLDTVFYMGYGNPAIVTNQSNPPAVWGVDAKGVYYLSNGTVLSATGATGNNATNNGATAAVGKVDGGAAFNGSSQYIQLPSTTDWNFGTADFTISCWFKVTDVASGYQILIGKDTDTNRQWTLGTNAFGVNALNFFSFPVGGGGVSTHDNSVSSGTWYLGHITRTGTLQQAYLNGAANNTPVSDSGNYTGTGVIDLGRREYPGFPQDLTGSMDEVRIINGTARSADWIAIEYSNQSAPTSFVTLGVET